MKVKDILSVSVGTVFPVSGPLITKELIVKSTELCGFANAPHIRGDVSLFSLRFGIQGEKACLCGAGTNALLNAALESVFSFDEPYDVASLGYDEIQFESPNFVGGSMEFKFTLLAHKPTKIRMGNMPPHPGVKVDFACEGFNALANQRVINISRWKLLYFVSDFK